MKKLGIDTPRSGICHTIEGAEKIAEEIGFPLVVRPAYTMGGQGGGFCYNVEELRTIVANGLDLSMTHQCLIEESILGWEELEVEVVRDSKNQMIAICFIENIDAVGVHTGDSFCSAPFMTIDKALEERLKKDAFKIVESIGVIGGTNVQFAHNPKTGRVVIIEINPRTSRSSALASKATGFPIALISAKLASGMTLDEIPYWRDGTLDKYTPGGAPDGDYVVLKFARWAFEKFRGVEDSLGTSMKAVGEVMSIGKTFKETFQKAIRGLENGRPGLGFAKDFNKKSAEEYNKEIKRYSELVVTDEYGCSNPKRITDKTNIEDCSGHYEDCFGCKYYFPNDKQINEYMDERKAKFEANAKKMQQVLNTTNKIKGKDIDMNEIFLKVHTTCVRYKESTDVFAEKEAKKWVEQQNSQKIYC